MSDRKWERMNARFLHPFDYIQFVYYIVSTQVIYPSNAKPTTTSDICRFIEWIIRIGYCRWIWGFVLVFKIAHIQSNRKGEKKVERNISSTVFKANQNRYGKNKSPTCSNNAHSIRCYRCPKSSFNVQVVTVGVAVVVILLAFAQSI